MQNQPTLPQLAHQFQRFATEVQQTTNHVGNAVLTLKKRLYELEAVAELQADNRKPRTGRRPTFRSQSGEDCVIWELLDRQTRGFYIEVGAFDGKAFSVTYAFDAMGWDGLLIEAIPQRAEQCKANRPDARVVHAALGEQHGGTVKFHVTDDAWGGMLSFTDPHSDHAREAAASRAAITTVEVPKTSLNEQLKNHAGGEKGGIDVAVIDVEGGELDVLKGFNLKQFKPRMLLLEDNGLKERSPLATYMQTQDYHLLGFIGNNRIYVHKDEKDILDRVGFRAQ